MMSSIGQINSKRSTLILLIVIVAGVALYFLFDSVRPLPFDKTHWLEADPDIRGRMLPSLLDCKWQDVNGFESTEIPKRFRGMSEVDVREMLGAPDESFITSNTRYRANGKARKFLYDVGFLGEMKFANYSHSLTIVFSESFDESRVIAVEVPD